MTDPRNSARTLWSRLISGEMLDEKNLRHLKDVIQQDPSLRDEIEADSTLHALLRSMTDVQQTEDEFVQRVLEKCRSSDSQPRSAAEVNRVVGAADGFSIESTDCDVETVPPPINVTTIRHRTNRVSQHQSSYRKRRRHSAWMALSLTAATLACIGLFAWTQIQTQKETANVDSTPQTVKPPSPQSPSSPEAMAVETDNPALVADDGISSRPSVPIESDTDRQNAAESPRMDIPPVAPPKREEGIANAPDTGSPIQFVTLTKVAEPVWERTLTPGDRLGHEIVRLFAGTIELTFDGGAVVTVDGPIEFRPRSTGELELRRGRLLASVPRKAIGFTVSTPTSTVVDLGTEFEVSVNDAGESDVLVRQGEVEVGPIAPDGDKFRKWRLLPGRFDRASFYARPDVQGPSPMSASIRGSRGQFQGFVSINGQTAEFTSAEAFDHVRGRVMTEFSRSQQEAIRQWEEFVNSMQKNMQGSMKVNGREIQFGSLRDVMHLQQRMLDNVPNVNGDAIESSFSGSINVNGKVMTFKTREEYDAARRAAFGPAAVFGVGDVFGERSTEK